MRILTNYKDVVLERYGAVIVGLVTREPRITLGDLIDKTYEESRSGERLKSEVRDAIMILTGEGRLHIEAISQKRLEVNLASVVT